MMINKNEPTCPTCGGTLIPSSHATVNMEENGNIVIEMVGTCDHCGNRYEWDEHFAYMGHNNVNLIKAKA